MLAKKRQLEKIREMKAELRVLDAKIADLRKAEATEHTQATVSLRLEINLFIAEGIEELRRMQAKNRDLKAAVEDLHRSEAEIDDLPESTKLELNQVVAEGIEELRKRKSEFNDFKAQLVELADQAELAQHIGDAGNNSWFWYR
jgi:hypothetical protein